MSGVGVGHGEIAVGQLLEGTAYRLLEVLGRGASAVVYRAEHTKLRTRVVIKWMNATMSADPDRAGRMRLEAQALARLAHPNLVAVTDSGVAGDRLFFVMEDDGGVALEAAIGASGRLSPEDAVRAVGDVLEGLAFIHESGLVHRDLHPDNLLVSTRADGSRVVRILDLGLVKVLSGHEQHRLGPLALPTAEGTTLGTPRYMAPEQVRGGPVDARSDLYAIGCVLHRLLVGRDPYAHHATAGQVLAAQLAEPVRPPSTWLPDFGLGPALERELMRALEKEPARRFASAHEMSAALRAAVVADGPARQSLPAPDSSEHPGLGGTIAITDVTPSPGATRLLRETSSTVLVGVSTTAPATSLASARGPTLEPSPTRPVSPAGPWPAAPGAPPAAVTTGEEPTLKRRPASGAPAVPEVRGPSTLKLVTAFAGSWLGFLLLTLVVLVATKGCGGASPLSGRGVADGVRLSTR